MKLGNIEQQIFNSSLEEVTGAYRPDPKVVKGIINDNDFLRYRDKLKKYGSGTDKPEDLDKLLETLSSMGKSIDARVAEQTGTPPKREDWTAAIYFRSNTPTG